MSALLPIDRPPRLQPELPSGEVAVPRPPEAPQNAPGRLAQVGLPLLTLVGYVLVSLLGQAQQQLLLIPMGLSVVATTLFSLYTLRAERQQQRAVEEAYADRLRELRKEMLTAHDLQRRFYTYTYPDSATLLRIAAEARAIAVAPGAPATAQARLWERRTTDEDFATLRLGIGTRPSTVVYTLDRSDTSLSQQSRAAEKLVADGRTVDDVPVSIAFRPAPKREEGDAPTNPARAPFAHALGIAGAHADVYAFTRSLLGQYATLHPPSDSRLYIIAQERIPWAWAETLPHCTADEQGRTLCFAGQATPSNPNPLDDEGGELEQFLESLRRTLATRKIRLQDNDERSADGAATLPFLLVVVDLLDAAHTPAAPLHAIATDAALAILLEEGSLLGAAVLFLVPERARVPGGCTALIELTRNEAPEEGTTEPRLYFRYAEAGVNSPHAIGVADSLTTNEMLRLVDNLSVLMLRQSNRANIAPTVPFLDLHGYMSLSDLRTSAARRWQHSIEPDGADWLRARIGLMAGNKPRTMVFAARRDGVHGMVAGSTGSGKSELLVALIASLAVNYDPSTLHFVLVDYKGGGAFAEFATLPHCVDIVTNLAADGVTRMFTAIGAEMRRRQALNTATGTRDIVEYRRKGLHLSHAPYPFLFIIIDEFAEMIADRPEYKAELESITRVGRAQGVSLILAAQRPSGVTDQMRSNIKFRICLRVETPSESRELLRRADAAFLPAGLPGRGFLQVGNEEVELIQVAYAGGSYRDPQLALPPVLWPERSNGQSLTAERPQPELYKAIIASLSDLAQSALRPQQHAPWPQPLPTRLALAEPLIAQDPALATVTSRSYLAQLSAITLGQPKAPTLALSPAFVNWLNRHEGWVHGLDWTQYALRPVVGLLDDPAGARQLPLIIDLARDHGLIVGGSGTGKTTMLRTALLSLAASHSPAALHIYALDLNGRGLHALDDLPHVGALISPDDEGFAERTEQVLRLLGEQIERRKHLLSTAGVDDLLRYNAAHPHAAEPAIVLAIDNLRSFAETFGVARDDVETTLARFVSLTRQSRPYGITVLATATQAADLPNQLLSLFGERFALHLNEPGDYRTLFGLNAPVLSEIPGRGHTVVGRSLLAFQVALPFASPKNGTEASSEARELAQICAHMSQQATAAGITLPTSVAPLPRTVLLRSLLAAEHGLGSESTFLNELEAATRSCWAASMEPTQSDWLQVSVGLTSGGRIRQLQLEAKKDGSHGMVAGGTGSGKSELLMTLIVGLALRYDPGALNFVLVDYKGGGAFKPFQHLPHCVESVTNLNRGAVHRMFTAIGAELRRRQRLNAETGTKDIVEYRQRGLHMSHAPYPHLFIIIDEYAEMIAESPEFGAELDSITRVGRAQGVFLLLAAQRPVGVSDQMRANIKLRICLRVEQADTSRELLRRADAAHLPNGMPGRGYIQVGNEPIELAQFAFTGDRDPHAPPLGDGEQPKFFDLVVQLAARIASSRPRAPWPPPLPLTLSLDTPLEPDYLDDTTVPGGVVAHGSPVVLNPQAGQWLNEQAAWQGVHWERTALRAVLGLADDPAGARQLPLVLDLSRGHGVIFGAAGWGKTTLLRTLATSLAATHGPDELHMHMLDLGGRGLEPLRALPHLGTLISPDEQGYEERVQQLWRELGDMLDERKRMLSAAGATTLTEYNAAQPERAEPAVLLLIDNIGELIETFGGDGKSGDGALLEQFVGLARQGRAYGLHIAVTAPRVSTLSSKLYSLFTERLALRLADPDEYSGVVGARVPPLDELPGRGYARVGREALAFQVALVPSALDREGRVRGEAQQIRLIAEHMQRTTQATGCRTRPLRIDALPKSVALQGLLAESLGLSREPGRFVAGLVAATRARWAHNASAEHADWLQVPLGAASGGRTRVLRLEAKHDGVHGMVAGGTGSGKSELLMSLIIGLALSYPPEILTFVLVDYKGGGAFQPFAELPHCVDIVTNLNPAAVVRMFTAIGAEINRRQALNTATGTKDIIEYRRKGLHLTHEPYPHLFIIIDEYAEMIDANEEFRQALDSITRVGRAQGVNLVLAAQQPKGVSDQMRANIKLRLCLRVEQQETSRELLRRPDAALLPSGLPGRGYLQVGNEQIELIQMAYAGEVQPDDRPPPLLWPERVAAADGSVAELPRFFELAVNLCRELAEGRSAPRPWPPFLPEQLSLESTSPVRSPLLPEVASWLSGDTAGLWPGARWDVGTLRPVIGLLDDPIAARQEPLYLDIGRSHLAVLGESGSGKTSLLRTLAVSLAASYAPDELHLYAIDLGGRGLRSLERLPHVGTVIYGDEERFEERLQRLLDLLAGVVETRQRLVSEADAGSVIEFNARYPDRALPAVVVLIDMIADLVDGYEAAIELALIPLARRALNAGITLVVTANIPTAMPSRLYSLLGERLTFRQANADRYADIVGRGAVEIGDTPGRGYLRRDGRPLLFQIGLPIGMGTSKAHPPEAEELRLLAKAMAAEVNRRTLRQPLPDPVQVLGERIPLATLFAQASSAPANGEVLLGQGENLAPVRLDLRRDGPHFLVVGPPRSGKTTTLTSVALALAARYQPTEVGLVFIDLQRGLSVYGGNRSLAELPHTLAVVSEIEQLEALVACLEAEVRELAASQGKRVIYLLIDNLDELSEELEAQRELARRLSTLVQRHGRDGLHVVATTGAEIGASELRRKISARGLGLALCSAEALESLRVQRIPASLRGRELPTGRGYLVHKGKLTAMLVAAPSDTDDDGHRAATLDAWVQTAIERAGEQRAVWIAAPSVEQPPEVSSATPPPNAPLLGLLQRGIRWELERSAPNGKELLALRLAHIDPARWHEPQVLGELLRELWRRILDAQGLGPEFTSEMIADLDDESLRIALESELAP
jgi:DNA segregation ATPase FtsK/SpoIIIE, S-DNA-T family